MYTIFNNILQLNYSHTLNENLYPRNLLTWLRFSSDMGKVFTKITNWINYYIIYKLSILNYFKLTYIFEVIPVLKDRNLYNVLCDHSLSLIFYLHDIIVDALEKSTCWLK